MKKTNDQSLTRLADAAFAQAAQKVIERAQQSGTPVIVWEDEAISRRKVEGGMLKEEIEADEGAN